MFSGCLYNTKIALGSKYLNAVLIKFAFSCGLCGLPVGDLLGTDLPWLGVCPL